MEEHSAAQQELDEIAGEFGASVRPSNSVIPGLSGGPLTRMVRLGSLRLPVEVGANKEWLSLEIRRETSLCFAGPVPERIIGCNRPLGSFAGVATFVPPWITDTDHTIRWLQGHADSFARFGGVDGERFLVARNRSIFYVHPQGVADDLQRLQALVAVLERLPADDDKSSPLAVPKELRELAPLIHHWALSDDGERSEAIAEASDDELTLLWRSVSPHLQEINSLLDATVDAQEVVVLGTLAQAAHEAHDELARRDMSPS